MVAPVAVPVVALTQVNVTFDKVEEFAAVRITEAGLQPTTVP